MTQNTANHLIEKLRPSSFELFRTLVIVAAVFACLIIGVSGVFINSPFAPLAVGAAFAAIAAVFFFLRKPAWIVYVALFIILLPIGLLPNSLQSNLNRVLSVGAFALSVIDILAHHRRLVWSSTSWAMLFFLIWCLLSLIWKLRR